MGPYTPERLSPAPSQQMKILYIRQVSEQTQSTAHPDDRPDIFRVLFIGEIVGSSGVFCVKTLLPRIKKEKNIDFVIADGEGATGGFGIGKNHSIYLHKLGIDVITSGECIYYKKDMVPHIVNASYILRPANYPYGNPGRGWVVFKRNGTKVGVVSLLGQSGFGRVHLANPFLTLPGIVEKIKRETDIIIVDFHATTTAEKNTMFYHMDGKISALIGTHFKVLTSDERVMPGGTAVITDAGRTGSFDSVGGLVPEIEIAKFRTQIPERSKTAWKCLELQGVLLDINADGSAAGIERLKVECKQTPNDHNGHNQRN
ncbi:2',3'-cyclic-nucleotide 2'-phosphodiesterase [subsurface metagenome]